MATDEVKRLVPLVIEGVMYYPINHDRDLYMRKDGNGNSMDDRLTCTRCVAGDGKRNAPATPTCKKITDECEWCDHGYWATGVEGMTVWTAQRLRDE